MTLLVSGCTSKGNENERSARANGKILVTRADRYTDLAKMRADSLAVVVGVVVSGAKDTYGGFPVTASTVQVSTHVGGRALPQTVTVEQLGTTEFPSPSTSMLLETGKTYLLFLSIDDGARKGRYVITGDDGIFERQGDRFLFRGGPGGKVASFINAAELDAF